MTLRIFAVLVAMISCTVAGNIFLKRGAQDAQRAADFAGWFSRNFAAGLLFFGLATVLYAFILRTLPLNVAQSLASAQFISVILASSLFLSESISPMRWLGIAMIAAGILIVGVSIEGRPPN
jgi:drug/metabolite transporter (DMT)-like permease